MLRTIRLRCVFCIGRRKKVKLDYIEPVYSFISLCKEGNKIRNLNLNFFFFFRCCCRTGEFFKLIFLLLLSGLHKIEKEIDPPSSDFVLFRLIAQGQRNKLIFFFLFLSRLVYINSPLLRNDCDFFFFFFLSFLVVFLCCFCCCSLIYLFHSEPLSGVFRSVRLMMHAALKYVRISPQFRQLAAFHVTINRRD